MINKFFEKDLSYQITRLIIIWWFFAVIFFIFSSDFQVPIWFWFLTKINPWIWWDSFWGINSVVAIITLLIVFKTYHTQKEITKEQKLQSLISELLSLNRQHFKNFEQEYNNLGNSLETTLQNSLPDEEKDRFIAWIEDWKLNSIIYYFQTLKYLEDKIYKDFQNKKEIRKEYIRLIEI